MGDVLKNINEAKDYILNRRNSKGIHSLEKIKLLLDKFDNPQDKIRVIHIAGTNGKGSTTKMISACLAKSYKVGTFTSPYIKEINENIAINGKAIADSDFLYLINKLKNHIDDLDKKGYYLTYFEILTAMMYLYFYEENVDIAIVETGLGGLLDATNIIKKPLASVITSISKDHIEILGDSLEEIAYQKAGIIKEESQVFLYPQENSVYKVIKAKADECRSKLFTFSRDEVVIKKSDDRTNNFDFRNYKDVEISLLGIHQIYNASLSLMVLDYFKDEFNLDEKTIKEEIYKAKNPGRLSLISQNPRIIVDGGHNRDGIDKLISSLETFKYQKLIVGFSILKDKEYAYIIDRLTEIADELIITSIDSLRAFEIRELREIVKEKFPKVIAIEDNKKAYNYAKEIAGPKDLIIWCGSLYLIGEIYEGQI